ncbi:MAG: hypothetical protein ACRDSL_09095 [Pseudonocardiaceae bacterium]
MSSTSPAPHALRISAADAVVTVLTTEAAVADWLTSYLGSWWTVQELPTAADVSDVPVLRCSLDPAAYRSAHEHAHSQPHHVVEFARKPILVASRFDAVHAIDPDEQVDYHAAQNGVRQVTLVGAESLGLCLAAARIARELVRVELEASGWSILHASAVVHDHSALLSVGPKGAGKTTAALLLARDGWQLLANDRVFLHPATLALLPWPSAAALGIGLLHAHGLLDGVHERITTGHQLHPTVNPTVVAAISDGRTEALIDEYGKELKPQFFPHQLVDWLGLHLARSATAGQLLFPRIDPTAQPGLEPTSRSLTSSDFFDPASDDRYPDFLQLARISPEQRHQTWLRVVQRVEALPHRAVLLNHDAARSRQLLATLTAH